MKIHIIGASGSGKTYLAHELGEKYQIPVYSLDDLLWDNSKGSYNVKRDTESRDSMLQEILQKEDWIIEGVQYSWCEACFRDADVIYLLETPKLLCRVRIIRRFFKRKLEKTNRSNETVQSVIHLLKWTKKFYAVNMPEIREILKSYEEKMVVK